MFLPKFHCELNPIELVWGQVKCYFHANCDNSFSDLKKIDCPALDSVGELIQKYFRKVHEYLRACR